MTLEYVNYNLWAPKGVRIFIYYSNIHVDTGQNWMELYS